MRITAASALALGLLGSACTVGPTDDPDPATGEISGTIGSDQVWSGEITIVGETTIAAGVTVTVEPGTAIGARDGVGLRVAGRLDVAGTEASPVTMLPAAGSTTWAGIVAETGGAVDLAYVEGTEVATLLYCHAGTVSCTLDHVDFVSITQAIVAEGTAVVTRSRLEDVANGGLTVTGAGNLTVRDSYVLTSSGDIIVQNGGTLLIEYSEIGDAQGAYDHCNLHIGSAASLTITHTNIINGVYGMMLGGTTGAVMTYNNWSGNDFDISEVGDNSNVDARYSYWANGAPAMGAEYDVSSPSATMISDAGPRP